MLEENVKSTKEFISEVIRKAKSEGGDENIEEVKRELTKEGLETAILNLKNIRDQLEHSRNRAISINLRMVGHFDPTNPKFREGLKKAVVAYVEYDLGLISYSQLLDGMFQNYDDSRGVHISAFGDGSWEGREDREA